MINIDRVTKTFDSVIAIENLSLHIQKGEILGLVGPDGAGKTTLIRMMIGLLAKFSGNIEVLGSTNIESIKNKMGYVPQKFSLYQDLTVMENIVLIGSLYGIEKQKIQQKAEEILTFTGLWQFKNRLAGNLSGGMKQKLALAAGLMHKPLVFFLDEPTTGVDPVARREFWQLLYNLNKEGMTIVVATPYMDEAELCHRVAFINLGQLISCQTPAQLISAYPHQILELSVESKHINRYLDDCYLLDLHSFGNKYHVVTNDIDRTRTEIQHKLTQQKIPILKLQNIKPSLEDVFVLFTAQGGV